MLNATLAIPVLAGIVLVTPVVPMIVKMLANLVPEEVLDVPEDRPFPRRFGPGSQD